jgi:pimeloyl-ACP methyl ester carboxylesterase
MDRVRSADGTRIAFDRSGEGPALVLVGGALSERSAAANLATRLASRFTVIAYDRRGRGDSGDTAPYAPEREVEDLEALIRAVGGSAFVFGHSSGAALALMATRTPRDSVSKLALYEPPFIVDDSRAPLPDDYVSQLDELVAAGRPGDAVEYFLRVGVLVPDQAIAQMRDEPSWQTMEGLAHTLDYDGRIMGGTMAGRPLPTEWATSVTVPTLVMDGGSSPEWQHRSVEALADLVPHAERVTLEGQDHGAASDVLAPVLESFFLG